MLCVIAKIDSEARERLLELQQLTESFGVSPRSLYGHITLANYVGDDEERFILSCKALLSDFRKFSVRYDKIEVLTATSIIVASPLKENNITDIQKEIVRNWGKYLDDWTQENVWKPHTTLLYKPQVNLQDIAEVMQEKFKPFNAQINRIEFSRVKENGYEIIDFIELL